MRRLENVMRGAVVELTTVRKQRAEIAKPEPVTLPDELRRQVNVLAGRVRFGDHCVSQEPEYHPDAAERAAKLRELEAPATAKRIEEWLAMLALGVANAPTEPSIIAGQLRLIHMACGNLPAAVWTDEALIDALDAFKGFWPTPADLKAYQHRRADDYRSDIRQLDIIAKAPPARGPAREAKGYDPGPAVTPPEQRAEELPEHQAHLPVRTVEEQLAAYGLTPEAAAAALAARRKVFGQ